METQTSSKPTPGSLAHFPAKLNGIDAQVIKSGPNVLGFASGRSDTENEANAQLWIAAPDLLELAKQIDYFGEALIAREYEPGSRAVTALVESARRAVANVEGR